MGGHTLYAVCGISDKWCNTQWLLPIRFCSWPGVLQCKVAKDEVGERKEFLAYKVSLVLHPPVTILGIPPGTVVISQKAVNATLAESHEMVSAGVCACKVRVEHYWYRRCS